MRAPASSAGGRRTGSLHGPVSPAPDRIELDVAQTPAAQVGTLVRALVVPRPIAWVATRSAAGVDNLAPHSFFTVASTEPPIVQFTSTGRKDSLRNVEATGEFVVCLAPEPLFEAINETATDYPPDVSEFDAVGLAREPSARVAPPRVAASPAALECVLHDTVAVGNGTLVLGRVVHVAVAAAAVRDGRPAIDVLRPLARLGGRQWSAIGEVREISRRRWADAAAERPPTA